MTDSSDAELSVMYIDGHVGALAVLFERYERQLFGFTLRMTGGHDEAEDVCQEVWQKVIRRIDTYRQGSFFGWIAQIARRTVIDRSRRRRPTCSLDAENEHGGAVHSIADTRGSPSHHTEADDLGRRIAAAVNRLPPEQKEVFILRTRGEVPFRQIAAHQKVPINTALARMHYALNRLRPQLSDEYRSLTRHAAA